MKVFVLNQQKDLRILAMSAKAVIRKVLECEGFRTDEICVHFVSQDEICRLHEEFFKDSSPTDCISFPVDDKQETGYHVLGDVFICPRAAMQCVTSDLVYQEATLYLVHGLLHLIGYNDLETSDIRKMRQAEKRHMSYLLSHNILLKPS